MLSVPSPPCPGHLSQRERQGGCRKMGACRDDRVPVLILAVPWLPLWGSCHEVTERVKMPSPPSVRTGHLSQRERQGDSRKMGACREDRMPALILAAPWLPLWGSCHEVTERVKTPSPPSVRTGHLSRRERQGDCRKMGGLP